MLRFILIILFFWVAGLGFAQKNGESAVIVSQDPFFNPFFIRNRGWNGGDGAYSLLLPDGRILWSFGDSFYGKVDKGRVRDGNKNVMVRNAFLVQQTSHSEKIISLNPGKSKKTKTFFRVDGEADNEFWYWPLDATVHENKIQMALMRMKKTGDGMWGFAAVGVDVGILSLPDLKLEKIIPKKYSGESGYGSAIFENDDGYTYLYGSSRSGLETNLHAARVKNGDLTSTWQFWNGTNWQSEPSDFAIHKNVSSMFSVWKEDNRYYILTQESNLGRKIFLFGSVTPVGPFEDGKVLFEVPEEHGSGKMFSYNAIVHPELAVSGELVVSYSKNPHNFFDNFNLKGSADLYLPVFLRITNWKNEYQ